MDENTESTVEAWIRTTLEGTAITVSILGGVRVYRAEYVLTWRVPEEGHYYQLCSRHDPPFASEASKSLLKNFSHGA